MGIYQRNGTVITAGTTNWAGGLSSAGSWGPVDQITQNILKTLSLNPDEATKDLILSAVNDLK
jgi:hypothetical protein